MNFSYNNTGTGQKNFLIKILASPISKFDAFVFDDDDDDDDDDDEGEHDKK